MRQREYELQLQQQRKLEEMEKMRLEAQRRHQRWLQLRGWNHPRSFAFNVLQHTILAIPKLPELGYSKVLPIAQSNMERFMNRPMLEVQPYRLDKKKLRDRRFVESDIENTFDIPQGLNHLDLNSTKSRNTTKRSERMPTLHSVEKAVTNLSIAYPGYAPEKIGASTTRANQRGPIAYHSSSKTNPTTQQFLLNIDNTHPQHPKYSVTPVRIENQEEHKQEPLVYRGTQT